MLKRTGPEFADLPHYPRSDRFILAHHADLPLAVHLIAKLASLDRRAAGCKSDLDRFVE